MTLGSMNAPRPPSRELNGRVVCKDMVIEHIRNKQRGVLVARAHGGWKVQFVASRPPVEIPRTILYADWRQA